MNLMIIAAESFIEIDERPVFSSGEERERCVQLAIEQAQEMVQDGRIFNAVVTASNSLMAMVRWNLAVDADPPVEVARFRGTLVPY